MKNEDRFHTTLDYMLEGCQIIGFDWRYVYLNRTAEIHNKRPNTELIGKQYLEMWPGIEKTEVFKLISHTLTKRISHRFENKFIFPDGTPGWFDLSIQPVPEGVFILSIDITDRKLAEEKLKKSEEKYRLLSDNSDDWIYWITSSGKLKYISPSVERLTGYTTDEFEKRPELILELVHPEDKQKVITHHQDAHNNHKSERIEFRIITREGKTTWIIHSCSPIFSPEGDYLGQRATNRDITERKLNNELLIESESRFRKIFEEGPFGMVMATKDFLFIKANPLFCKIIGYTETELQKLTFKDISHPEDVKKDLINVKKLINKEISVYKIEKRYIRKDGQIIWASLSVNSNYDNEGNFLYNLGIIEDITHRKQVEEALQKSKKLLAKTESMGKVGGWEFNIETKIQTWTEEVYRIHEVDFDFNPNVNKGINFYTTDSQPIIENAVKRAIQFGEPFDLELEIITARGNLRNVHTIGKTDLEHRRVYGFFQDITERKRVEEEIRKLNEQISTATRASQVGIWDWDVQNNVLAWDDQMYALYGVKKEEFAGAYEAWVNGLHPDDKEHGITQTQLALKGEKDYDTEFRVVWPNGTIRHCKAKGEVFRNEKGEPIRMVGVNYDITEISVARKTIIAKHELFRKTFNISPLSSVLTKLTERTIVEVNPAFEKLFGYSSDEVVGKPVNHLVLWADATHQERVAQELLKNGKVQDIEFVFVKKSGETGIGLFYSEVIEQPSEKYVLTKILDITERKQSELALRESEEKFSVAFKSSPTALLLTRLDDGQFLEMNDSYCAIVGYQRTELIGHCTTEFNIFINPSDRNKIIQQLIKKKSVRDFETSIRNKSGEIKHVIASQEFVRIGDNACILTSMIDITDRKKAEEEIRKLNETLEERVEERTKQLQEANQELEAFSYSVSHDLRAPLRHINGFVDLLTGNYADLLPEKAKHYLDVIVNSSRQMGNLIDDLLQFSRTGRQEMKLDYIDMNLVFQEVLKLIKQEAENRNINWQIDPLPVVKGDHSLLKMVWFNLLSNALKFTKTKDVTLIHAGFKNEDEEFIFFVQDNGAGFDMQYAHKLFGVFQRLHSRQEFEGTGIGLANVRRIIAKHGGKTWAESEINKGAKFYFSLPKY